MGCCDALGPLLACRLQATFGPTAHRAVVSSVPALSHSFSGMSPWLAQACCWCKRGQPCPAAQALLNNLEAELAGPSARVAQASAAQTPAEPSEAAPPADTPAAETAPAQPGAAADAAGVPAAEGEPPGEPAGEPAGESGGAGEADGAAASRVARVTSDSVSMASETGEARGGDEDAGSGGAGAAGTSGQVGLCGVVCPVPLHAVLTGGADVRHSAAR